MRMFCALLERGAFVENAAARIGWDVSMLRQALRKGRAGVPGFKQFVETMDDILLRQGDDTWTKILEEASRGNFSALKYIHQTRVLPRQTAVQKAMLDDEFGDQEEEVEAAVSPADLDRAEARALASRNEASTDRNADRKH